METQQSYYVPEQSKWPIIATVGLFLTLVGLGNVLINNSAGTDPTTGWWMLGIGFTIMVYMLFGWFGNVAQESMAGLYSPQMDRSFRWGMAWFIFSEVMFFSAFFGALFYARFLAIPWIAGEGNGAMNTLLWPEFENTWPLLVNPDPSLYPSPKEVISPWQIPLLNTLLLLTSSVTITFAHHAIKEDHRDKVVKWMAATVALGVVFMGFQIYEYIHAYSDLDLTLASGIYGTTFFMLTGCHGAHVTLGAIIIFVIMMRYKRGHFSAKQHFGFEAAAWYWHFVDVVWVCLFFFVYIL